MANMVPETVESLANAPIPWKLWHYTDFNGFCGIVKSKSIYATNIRYLNDREEFNHAIGIAKEMLDEITTKYGDNEPIKTFLPEILAGFFETGALSPQNTNIYTASFSLKEDQLSQWRGYSNGSCGVSLGFDLRAFRPPEEAGTLAIFAPCIYEDQPKSDLVRRAISDFADRSSALNSKINDHAATLRSVNEIRKSRPNLTFKEAAEEQFSILSKYHLSELKDAATAMAGRFLRLAALLKHSAFEEEQEWRFALPIPTNRPPVQNPIKYRSRANTLVPYIEFPLRGKFGDFDGLPLTDIIIGPGAEFETAIDAARGFLVSEGILNVLPRRSRIPYRPW